MYQGYVYVLNLGFDNLYKIGATGDLEYRLKTLRAGNPRLKIEFAYEVRRPHPVESQLHDSFRHKQVEREIFELEGEELGAIRSYLKVVQDKQIEKRKPPVAEISKQHPNGMISLSEERESKAIKKCPRCSSGYIVVRENRQNNSKFLGCDNWPICRYSEVLICGNL